MLSSKIVTYRRSLLAGLKTRYGYFNRPNIEVRRPFGYEQYYFNGNFIPLGFVTIEEYFHEKGRNTQAYGGGDASEPTKPGITALKDSLKELVDRKSVQIEWSEMGALPSETYLGSVYMFGPGYYYQAGRLELERYGIPINDLGVEDPIWWWRAPWF